MSKDILVIDDDDGIRKSFILALKDTGYNVDTAGTGEEGIKMERSNKYDLIFLDLKMSGMDGIEVLREIRKVIKETPIYIITAYYDFSDELKTAGDKSLIFDVIRKPFHCEQILSIAKKIFEG